MRNVAVLDIGKTNVKVALMQEGTLAELAVVSRPNTVRPGPPWPHFDLEGHWAFFLHHLSAFHRTHGVDAISVTAHGASAVLLDRACLLAVPMLDYEHHGPHDLAEAYAALRPPFTKTGSPRLPMGLNLGAQLHWQLSIDPDLRNRLAHVVTYPQYWGFRLTAELACDLSSLGCHTDLWNPWAGDFSGLVDQLGLTGRIAPPRRPDEVLGTLRPELAAATGLPATTPVSVGIHDSNASLYPHLLGRRGPFGVVSTGTWVICMAMGGARLALDPSRDVLVNVNALGQPVPSARFMGGREFEILGREGLAAPTQADRTAVLKRGVMLLPAVEPRSGPFQGRASRWSSPPASEGERMLAASWYLALMTRSCLDLVGARGVIVVEGPFARNPDYLDMLASVSPDGVEVAASVTGTSVGAALLALRSVESPVTRAAGRPDPALASYADAWCATLQATPEGRDSLTSG